jgi:8-amino-7-oxononanoate synthase
MLDFTSSLYLGIQHDSQSIKSWQQLTTGRPAALLNPEDYSRLANRIAMLQGLDAGVVAPSTLHLFWDLFGILGKASLVAFIDSESYPIAQWGLERFACQGNSVIKFRHHNPDHLRNLLKTQLNNGQRPIVVTDGWCTDCGQLAPLRAYLDCVRQYKGLLIVDDTQALGILGRHPHPAQPYGLGGGGSLPYLGIGGPDIILISSLAKGFGVPMAVMSGSHRLITKFKDLSETRVHCSPPSWADIYAAEHALYINQRDGDRLRQKLFKVVRHFKQRLLEIGIKTKGGIFPVQKLVLADSVNVNALHLSLRQAGLRTVLVEKTSASKVPEMVFVLNANHRIGAVHRAVGLV